MASTGIADVRVGTIPRTMRAKGLLLESIDKVDLDRFMLGVKFEPRGCTQVTVDDPVWCATEDFAAATSRCLAWLEQFPFHIIDGLQGSTLNFSDADLDDRLQLRYDELMSWAFARTLVGSSNFAGLTLASQASAPDGGYGSGVSATKAMAILENELAKRLSNAAGIIHVSPGVLTAILPGIVEDGPSTYATMTGHRVVADAGYYRAAPPTGQAASSANVSEWIYASGPIQYDVTPLNIIGEDDEDSDINFRRNLRTQFAQAWGAFIFDPCPVTAVLVTY